MEILEKGEDCTRVRIKRGLDKFRGEKLVGSVFVVVIKVKERSNEV